MLSFYGKYNRNIRGSQNGEDGIIQECIARIQPTNKVCVEIGGHNGEYCSNTSLLIHKHGWSGKFIEADFDLWNACCQNYRHIKDRVKSVCSMVGPENVNAFVDDSCDILSVDVDGTDKQILQALIARPKVIIIEINSGFPPDIEHDSFEQGSSYLTMAKAAIDKGYFVLCHTGNMVLVEETYRELFPEVEGDGIGNHELYFRRDWLKKTA